jgi:hypothetical protein
VVFEFSPQIPFQQLHLGVQIKSHGAQPLKDTQNPRSFLLLPPRPTFWLEHECLCWCLPHAGTLFNAPDQDLAQEYGKAIPGGVHTQGQVL